MAYNFNPQRKWGANVQKRLFVLHKTSADLADAIGRTPEHLCAVMAGRPSKKVRAEVEKVLRQWEEQTEQRWQEYLRTKY